MSSPPSPDAFLQAAALLGPQSIDRLVAFYHPMARFQDPFQTVIGRQAIASVYRAMFKSLVHPRFTDLAAAVALPQPTDAHGGPCWAVRWVFRFQVRPKGPEHAIAGTSWLWLCPQTGLIQEHQDHWDASALFAAFPALAWLVRGLKKRIAAAGHLIEKP